MPEEKVKRTIAEDARTKGNAIKDTLCQFCYVPLDLSDIASLGLDENTARSKEVVALVRQRLKLPERTHSKVAVKKEIAGALNLPEDADMKSILEAIKEMKGKKK